VKRWQDILTRSKEILLKHNSVQKSSLPSHSNLIDSPNDIMFLKSIFSFHPTKGLNHNEEYEIEVGLKGTVPTYFLRKPQMQENDLEDNSISVRKSTLGL